MSNAQRNLVRIRLQLMAYSTTDQWLDLSPFVPTVGVGRIRGRTVLCDKLNNFRFKVGIQTVANDPEFPDSPAGFSTGTGVGYVSTLVRNFVDVDPTVSGNGLIATKQSFRVGVLYSTSDGLVGRGEVIVELWIDA